MNFDIDSIGDLIMAYGLKVVMALVIFFVGKFVVRKLVDFATIMMRKSKLDETLISFAEDVLFALGIVLVVIAALNQLGIDTTSLAAILAAAGLAIGLSLQGSLSNLAAGIMIIMFRPIKVKDYVQAGGTEGFVEDISIFTTVFITPDNKKVIVPNNEITSGIITNFSAKKTRRIDLVIGVGYDDDLAKTKKALNKVITAHKSVLKTPEPQVAVSELADSSVNFVVRPWVKTKDYWDVRFDLIEQIKVALDKEGISIPYPQRDLHIVSGDAPTTKTVAKKSPSPKKAA